MDSAIIIPAHNEEENLSELLNDLIKLRETENLDYEVIVVNDNSSDSTPTIIRNYEKIKYIRGIHRKKGRNGMGYALIEGTKQANADKIIWVMGDRSDDLKTIPDILKKLDSYDMVMASRYIRGGSSGDMAKRKALLSWGYTAVARRLFNLPVHDITNAFRGFRKKTFNNIKLESGDFAISPEFAIKAHKKGYKLGETPTRYHDRQKGETKFNFIDMGRKYTKLFLLKFKRVR